MNDNCFRAVVRHPMKYYEKNKVAILNQLRSEERLPLSRLASKSGSKAAAATTDGLGNVLNLVTHHESTSSDDQLVLAASACFLVHTLSCTPYFADIKSKVTLCSLEDTRLSNGVGKFPSQ